MSALRNRGYLEATRALPEELQDSLPTIEQIEAGMRTVKGGTARESGYGKREASVR